MRPLVRIAIKSGHRYGCLNYQTLIPTKGRGNPDRPI